MTRASVHAQAQIRTAEAADGAALWSLARRCGLDENSPYAYLMWTEYFGDTTVVAVDGEDGDPIAFVTGFRPPADPTTVFVWQVGVDEAQRGRGLGGALLDHLVASTGARHLEATVTPDNKASDALFRALGDRHGAPVVTEELFAPTHFPPSTGHDAEIRYRIGPLE